MMSLFSGDDNWDVAWGDTTAGLFRGVQQLKPFQRVNHFPSPGHNALLVHVETIGHWKLVAACRFDNDMKSHERLMKSSDAT